MSASETKKPGTADLQAPGFFRHMAAMAYDSILLLALLFLATALALPFNNGEAFSSSQFIFPVYIFLVSFCYFGWFWTHGGQTLGMKTWKLKLLTQEHQNLSWPLAFKRFLLATLSLFCIGLGFLWKFIDKKHYTWHDRLSKTVLFYQTNN